MRLNISLGWFQEKECNAKFMQYVSGVNVPIFWIVSIVWDILTSLITSFIIVLMLALGNHQNWNSFSDLALAFSIFLAYNFAMMPIICVFSLFFTKPSTGMIVIFTLNVAFGT